MQDSFDRNIASRSCLAWLVNLEVSIEECLEFGGSLCVGVKETTQGA